MLCYSATVLPSLTSTMFQLQNGACQKGPDQRRQRQLNLDAKNIKERLKIWRMCQAIERKAMERDCLRDIMSIEFV